MNFLKMFKANDNQEKQEELDEKMKEHYEAFITAKETYYTYEELMTDKEYQEAREILGYPRTDRDINNKKR